MATINEAIEEFLLDGQASGWSPGTVATYRWHLARWLRWLAEHGAADVGSFTRRLLREWSAGLAGQWAPATRKGAVTAVKAFVGWLADEDLVSGELLKGLKVPNVPRKVQRTLTADEVQALLRTCETPAERGIGEEVARLAAVRNAAIVALLYDSLIRASELCGLRIEDLDMERGICIVRCGKGGKGRRAPFGVDTRTLLRAWLDVRPAVDHDRLFFGLNGLTPGAPLTASGLRLILRRLGERAGVAGVSPHAFRRGGAVAATLNGAPGRLVQLWAGWADMKMLETYTRALEGSAAAIEAYGPFSPVSTAVNGKGAER